MDKLHPENPTYAVVITSVNILRVNTFSTWRNHEKQENQAFKKISDFTVTKFSTAYEVTV